MSRVIVNGKYLTETKYFGSGFHSYLKELIRVWAKITHNQYYILFPQDSNITISKLNKLYLTENNSSRVSFHSISRKNEPFENVIVKEGISSFHANHILFPHLELPDYPPTVPYSVIIHDIIPTLFITFDYLLTGKTPIKMISRQGITDYFLLRRHLLQIKNLITISETTRQTIISVFGERAENKIKVIPPAIGKKFYSLPPPPYLDNTTLEKFKLKRKKFVIYFGGYTFRKNYHRLIKGFTHAINSVDNTGLLQKEFHSSPRIPLVMVGGEGRIKVTKNILTTPKLPEAELQTLVKNSAFSIYPSLFEGFGLPILESLSLGTLPILSDIPSSREIIPYDQPHLFFNPYNIKSISQSITHFLLNPQDITSTYDKIKDRVDSFSWQDSGKKIDSLFV